MNEDKGLLETRISKAKTLEDIAEFWDTHSLDDYWDETREVEFEVRAKRRRRVNSTNESVKDIRDFLSQFPREQLAGLGILRGGTRHMSPRSVDPLLALMREHNVTRLSCRDCGWFLDDNGNFNNPRWPDSVFGNQNLHLNPHYLGYRLVDSGELEDETDDLIVEASTITFGLERDLQKALRANIEELERGLKIIDGGKERSIEDGRMRIDITAEDKDGNLVVIELKAGPANPDSLTETLSYMAALEAEEGKLVRGILVAGDFHDRVVWAARKVPDLKLKQYSFSFSFNDR